ncbi:branched-chain amino acid ABC transporter permease [Leucobacter sp. wl10]|uniref:branched-chain amino acid ABC transporter permease n=1 Tax=Leucobacter sp. wl10 TaxID=2304677 RepID=UPI000E5A1067|nr:branched-chain amino acid ABC transporter permease [Leucobacter sp. wl10]RGE22421.1 branched-chain amino acid ABC transporter permease [Leucobacter sp. wl10]
MNPKPQRRRTASRGLLLVIITGLLAALGVGALASPAFGADCTPDASTACVQGVIKLSTGEPAPDISVSLTGGSGEQQATTDENGRWVFSVTEAGTYTVEVDEASLPEGEFFKSLSSREVQVQLNNQASALFPLTDDPEAAQAAGEAADSGEQAASSAGGFSWARFWQQFVSGIRMGLLIALASLGLSLVFGTTGLSNFAQGEMVTMGGLLAAAFMGLTGNLWLAGIMAVAVSALFGWTQDKILWKPLRRRRLSLMQLMIVSIGLSITLQYVFQFFFGSGVVRIDRSTAATVTIAGVTLTVQSYVAMAISLLAIVAVGLGLMYTRFGRATRAISDNPALARASGIDVDRVINVVWIVGGGLAGLAGVFFGLVFNGLNWFTGGTMLLMFFAAVTLGGLGTAFGAFVGSMIIGMMVELTNIWLPGDLKYATALLLLILILLVRPQGIFGRRERIG